MKILNGSLSPSIALVLGSMIMAAFCQPAWAAQAVDQSFTNPPYSSATVTSLTGDTLLAQSFTAGVAGKLTGADILAFDGTSWFGGNPPAVSDMTVQIRTFSGGVPTATVLATWTVPASNLVPNPNGQFTHVDFPNGVLVAPGQVFALTLSGAGVGWYLQAGSDATYAGGQAFVKAHAGYAWTPYPDPGGRTADFLFRTYVNTPDSASPKAVARVVSSQLTNGIFHVRFAGTSDHLFTIDRAENPAGSWQMGYTNLTSDATGAFELFDPVSSTAASGFYRVR
ncbi:MAG TPA: hypothetical protein VG167_19960 [Verrucomicrobiae bacterium]|nr:hypothetical protein [Verrucomicrobiae bacterium]